MSILTRIKYWWAKNTDTQFQWGHPDEWSDAEWFYYKKEK